jgi:hypothetical protein
LKNEATAAALVFPPFVRLIVVVKVRATSLIQGVASVWAALYPAIHHRFDDLDVRSQPLSPPIWGNLQNTI